MIQKSFDFTAGTKRARAMSDDQLAFAVKDCIEARDAMKGWNPVQEGYYQDEASTYAQEIYRRAGK